MKTRPRLTILLIIGIAIHVVGEGRAREADAAPVRAPGLLSETGLYADIAAHLIADGNLLFDPQYPLWSDGAEKARWIQLPQGTTIQASGTSDWIFPIGTKLWKEFAFNGKKIETRMLWRSSESQWVFATYLWNEKQSDALLADAAGVRNLFEMKEGAQYSIPSEADCHACHDSGGSPVLGFNALQLSDDRDPLAPNTSSTKTAPLTISSLDRLRLLQPRRRDLVKNPPRIQARSPRERAALGYLSSNCGNCHNERGSLAQLGLHLLHTESNSRGNEPGFATSVGIPGEWVTPGTTPAVSRRIAAGFPDASSIVYRMNSRRPSSQMPPLGTSIADAAALELIRGWIAEDLKAQPGNTPPTP